MQETFFITGTDTGAGKTVLTALLAEFLRTRGFPVAALKPVCSGDRDDAHRLAAALGGALTLDEINPWHFRAAIAPVLAASQEKRRVTLAHVLAHVRAIQQRFPLVLVEGAGGLLSPLGAGFDSRDLLTRLNATPIIAAPNRLGVVNHIRLTLEALPPKLRARARLVLIAPARPAAATAANAGLLRRWGVARIHFLDWLGKDYSPARELRRPAVRRMLAAVVAD